MTTVTNDAAKASSSKDFLVEDYELKVRYLTDHFSRMWTRFNYFVGHRVRARRRKAYFGKRKTFARIAIVGAVVSLIWYVMAQRIVSGARLSRACQDSADLLARAGVDVMLKAAIGTWVKWLSRRRDLTGNSAVGG